MNRLATFLALAAGVAPVHAQSTVYDAGTAGNPPVAPDPQTMGWNLFDWNGQVGLAPVSPDGATGLNAWEVADNTGTGRAIYEAWFFDPGFFEYTLTMRMTAGPSGTIFFDFQNGYTLASCHYRVDFRVQGADVIATDVVTGNTFVCANGTDGYHTYTMRRVVGSVIEFQYDGVTAGIVYGELPDLCWLPGARWGAYSNAGLGRARFHRVEFQTLPAPVGEMSFCGVPQPSSTGSPALLSAAGSPVVGGPGFALDAYLLPPNQFGYFLMSPNLRPAPGVIPPGSQGRLCLGPASIGRFSRPGEIQFSGAAGSFHLDVDTLDVPTNPPGTMPVGTMYFQGWFRDNNPGATSNFTTALRVVFQ
ncbi:MAG: hypothetical protein GY711_03970 [bacterium]|nr:hypothetical protein [bacterium]